MRLKIFLVFIASQNNKEKNAPVIPKLDPKKKTRLLIPIIPSYIIDKVNIDNPRKVNAK
ncbi:MAG: hypothetical protein Q6351_004725 [Candidatus Njordarchaeum guaymaensis]